MNNVLTVIFEDARQINHFCNEISSYPKKFKCRLKIVKDNSINSASLLSILRIGINTPFEIVIESYDGDNMKNVMKCKEEIERWFVDYGNDKKRNED